jgi:hypothetical protein
VAVSGRRRGQLKAVADANHNNNNNNNRHAKSTIKTFRSQYFIARITLKYNNLSIAKSKQIQSKSTQIQSKSKQFQSEHRNY